MSATPDWSLTTAQRALVTSALWGAAALLAYFVGPRDAPLAAWHGLLFAVPLLLGAAAPHRAEVTSARCAVVS
ncbi:MAG TPA: hypothetical protein VFD39_14020, partial [Trueperaceae bacterium]|nr:hypothetical protein [Trueperaceae bacterium]